MISYELYDKEKMAAASGVYLPFSPKDGREVAKFIKGKRASSALNMLDMVLEKKLAVPFKRFNRDRGHKRGIGPGAYPVKAVAYIKQILMNAIANARQKSLDVDRLEIIHINVSRAIPKERRRGKFVNLDMVLAESDKETPKKKKAPSKKPEAPEKSKEEAPKTSAVPQESPEGPSKEDVTDVPDVAKTLEKQEVPEEGTPEVKKSD